MDTEAEYNRKVEAMFGKARDHFKEVGIRFVVNVMERVVEDTPGFENQDPADTRYIPKGQLRGGYNISDVKVTTATVWDSDQRSDYGVETVRRIEAELRSNFRSTFYIYNQMAYAYIVREGRGRHHRPRDFLIAATGSTMANARDEAVASMGVK